MNSLDRAEALSNLPAPLPTAPFQQQGLEAPAGHACLKVNGSKIDLIIPPIGITGGPCAVVAACGIYAR